MVVGQKLIDGFVGLQLWVVADVAKEVSGDLLSEAQESLVVERSVQRDKIVGRNAAATEDGMTGIGVEKLGAILFRFGATGELTAVVAAP